MGRPETPEEAAARRADNSRRHRENQTARNLVLALLASLGIVFFLVVVIVRPDQAKTQYVDYHAAAAQAQAGVSEHIVDPALPSDWLANSAQLRQASGSAQTWYIGLITPDQKYLGLEQGIGAADSWFTALLGTTPSTGTASIAGVTWRVYDQRAANPGGNFAYALATTIGTSRFVLHGTATRAEFTQLATAVASQER
nr:DUF4245 family protein [Galbitalea soli]